MDRGRQEELVRGLLKRSSALHDANVVSLSARYVYDRTEFLELRRHEQRWLCAVAVGKSVHTAALAGRSAARIHGMWVIGPRDEPVELMPVGRRVPSRSQWPEGCIYLGQRARRAEIIEFQTLSATDQLSTAFEIALRHGFREGLVAMDWILRFHTTRDMVEAEMERLGPVTGINTLRKVVSYAVGTSMSPFESYARAILIEAGYDEWKVNAFFRGYKPDLRRGRFILEIDGNEKYDGQTYAPLDATILDERRREKHLQNGGAIVGRTSPHELLTKEDEFLTMVARLIALADSLGPLPEDMDPCA